MWRIDEGKELVYTAELTPGTSLEDIYTRFNTDHPEDFKVVLVYKCGQKKLNNLYYQMKEQRR